MTKYALSTRNQQIVVAKYIVQEGSINRYEADFKGVCHLAGRIKELKYRGFAFNWSDETVTDLHGIKHSRVRRYWFDYKAMHQKDLEKLNKFIGES